MNWWLSFGYGLTLSPVLGALLLPLAAWLRHRLGRAAVAAPRLFMRAWIGCAAFEVVLNSALRAWPATEGFAASLVIALIVRWWRRRKRRRTLALLGAKSKATIAALVRAMREHAQPRPVLAPGGAQ